MSNIIEDLFKKMEQQYPDAVKSGAIKMVGSKPQKRSLGEMLSGVCSKIFAPFARKPGSPVDALFDELKEKYPAAVKSGAIRKITKK